MSWGEISCFKYGTCPHGPTPGTCNRKCLHYTTKGPEPPHHDEALLRIYLSAMPLGKYSVNDKYPSGILLDGVAFAIVHCETLSNYHRDRADGLVAALVHLLNTREQTTLGSGTAP